MASSDPTALVTPTEVREIIDTDLTDPRLNNFINFAVVVTRGSRIATINK